MNHGTSIPKRCLALFMAAILIASNFSGLTNLVSATEYHSVTNSVGQIVADNYDLTHEEKALLESGLLCGESITYIAPTDSSLIKVNNDKKTIEVATYKDEEGNMWIPAAAGIYVGNSKKEDVTLTDGKGTYTYAENAFSVKVTYTLSLEIAESLQSTLLGAPAALKNGLGNMKTAFNATDANLGTVVMAMSVLSQLADGISLGWASARFDTQAAIDATERFEKQIAANGGKLDMQVWNEAYAAAVSKVQFLQEQGAGYKAVIVSTYEDLNAIKNDGLMNNSLLDNYLASQQPNDYTAWKALKGILNNTVSGIEPAANGDWSVLDNNVLAEGLTNANFAALDILVGNIETITVVDEITKVLEVANTTVTLNMSMFNVTVKIELQVVDANNNLKFFDTKQVTLTLPENATAEQIKLAVSENGAEKDALNAWADMYADGKFVFSESDLPDTLTEDITYTITYSPKYYTVSFGYAEKQSLPYGYRLELPKHPNSAQAYDYTVNGKTYAQGTTYIIVEDTTVTRNEGKAYTSDTLLNIVTNNYGNSKLDAILNSGALFGDESVNVRYPDATDNSLLTMEDGMLSAPNYDASYNNLSWVPYSYGVNGNENLFSGNTAPFTGKAGKVIYRLALTNYDVNIVKAWLELAVTLNKEAAGQISALNRLGAYTSTMGQLDKTKLGALNGVIDVTDLHTDPAKNAELKAYFKGIVSSIISECVDSNDKLRIYNMLLEYQAEGLIYYYQNSAAFQKELATVSGYLNGMLADDEKIAALTTLVAAAGSPEYADKIQNVGTALATLEAELTAPNAAINLDSKNLGDLVDALLLPGDASYTECGVLYLNSNVLTVTDASQKKVQMFVNGTVVNTLVFERGYVLTDADVAALKSALSTYVSNLYGTNLKYYNAISNIDLDSLIGAELDADINVQYAYTAKNFTVKIEGFADQIITIENLKINLPKSTISNIVYTYMIDGVEYTTSTYTFSAKQLDRLFTDGAYTIAYSVVDMGATKLQQIVKDLNNKLGAGSVVLVTNANGEIVGMEVNVEAAELMDVILGLTSYSYIGMNNEGLMYLMQDANGNYMTEISIQTVINALLSDNTFGSESLIALGKKGSGKLMSTTLQLGNTADDLAYNLDMTINLAHVPSQMGTVASALANIRSYLKFHANNGVLEFELNLPDQVYGAYLVALVATGNVDKSDAGVVDQKIAFQFLCDYLDAVIGSGTDMTTLQNTLAILGQNVSLENYNKYYAAFVDALSYKADETGLNLGFEVSGPATISGLLSTIGLNGEQLNTYLGMVKENKEGGIIKFPAHATMSEGREYCALVLDVNANNITDKFACVRADNAAALNAKLSKLSGYSIVILLSDVEGNLNIAGTTILDLNGKNVSGTINATGSLVIIDSSMDTYNAGSVHGVSGNATIIAGNYETDVSKYLKNGYYMDGTTVRNAMYYISSDANGNTSFVINTDVYLNEHVDGYLPDMRFVAIDMMVDLVLNYATTAGLSVDGNTVYDICFEDLLGMLESRSGEQVIDAVLACVNAAGLSNTINLFIEDLLDFAAIYEGLSSDGTVVSYDIAVAPWMVAIERVEDGNYLTLSIRSNAKLTKTFNLSLKLEGKNADYLKNLALELAGIVDDETYVEIEIKQPTYNDKKFDFGVSGNMLISLDMSKNSDYAKILAVILAYGNADKAADVAACINSGNINSLKNIVDNTTVKELFTALKLMNRNATFADMAAAIGVNVDVSTAAELEHVYHLILVATGKLLVKLDITGMNSKLGNLYDEESGYYVLDKLNTFRDGELSYAGFGAQYEIASEELIFRLKLFGGHTHVFGEWIVYKEATCTKAGMKVRVCSCGETEYAEIAALGHKLKGKVTKPTCTERGYTTYTCYACGHSFVSRYVAALGHNYVAVKTEPTCTEQGYTTYTCSTCGDSYVADYVPATGHEFGDWYEETHPTCTEDGLAKRECKHCDHYETKLIAALGHNFVDGLCTRCDAKDPNAGNKLLTIIIIIVGVVAAAAAGTFVFIYFKRKKSAE